MKRIGLPGVPPAARRGLTALGRAVRRWLGSLARETRGGLAPFFAISIIPLIAFVGIGTDTARGYILKSRLSYALDAAGLAGGRVIYSENRDADIQMYFDANFPPGYMGAEVDGPHFTVNEDNTVVTLDASATLGTTFLRVLGIQDMTVNAATEVTVQTFMLDVVLSMDVSGSMGSSAGSTTRIAAARDAATTLVNILYGNNSTNNLLNIGLVPWNAKVKVWTDGVPYNSSGTTPQSVAGFINPVTGAGQSTVYYANNSQVPLLEAPDSDWKGCVYARYVHDGNDGNDADLLEGLLSVGGKDWVAWEPIGDEGEPTSSWWTSCSSAVGWGDCTPCAEYGITPLQSSKDAILAAIDALQNPNGSTNIPQGLDMAWQVLTPAEPYTEAEENPQGNRKQAIVLLTDGENYGGSGDAYKGVFGLGSAAQPELDDRLRTLANNIKSTGVIIYAIQFGTITPEQEQLMKDVATGPDAPFYFFAPDAESLNNAFQQVANSLSELRLSK